MCPTFQLFDRFFLLIQNIKRFSIFRKTILLIQILSGQNLYNVKKIITLHIMLICFVKHNQKLESHFGFNTNCFFNSFILTIEFTFALFYLYD